MAKRSLLELDDEIASQVYEPIRRDVNPAAEIEDTLKGWDDDDIDETLEPIDKTYSADDTRFKGSADEILPDGTVIANGKKYPPHAFRPGNNMAAGHVKRNGRRSNAHLALEAYEEEGTDLANRTIIKKPKDIKEIRQWAKTYGMSRLQRIMERMNDADFVKTFAVFAPYLLSRLNAVDWRASDDVTAKKGEESTQHTVVIKDMRGKKPNQYEIADE